jgi:hypothetical protein
MKSVMFATFCLLASAGSCAAANCDDVKSAIAAKLATKNFRNYQIQVVPANKVHILVHGVVIGSCEGGARKIVYTPPPK